MSQVRIAQEPSLAELMLQPEGQIPSLMLRGMIRSGGRSTRHIRCETMLSLARIPQLASCVKPPTHFCQSALERPTAHRVGFMSIRSLGRFPMSATGLDVFDKTLQTTHIWLDETMAEIGSNRQVAWHVLGTVLRTVRDRIPLQLPGEVQAIWIEVTPDTQVEVERAITRVDDAATGGRA
jgi:hypothetical protein